ncbi:MULTISPECIES: NAD-dependent epimerase/dehydratase family protein [unclassified Methylobacterium]|jgi:nucleoside-diphosphate-sugar epimerase|uniref:NAD-dependent epimerase/dehydratase family protein n=1 Tax=unclassified Methylobacterium TaxID=2615210 RepID=UPI001353348B|nr:NAD(P)-dependent oxidoreductase [Methylobacterium sp. 2A]MWV22037.1 NAD(P)-dependent oxidoreductase [Methylobacterium sp. 2A]
MGRVLITGGAGLVGQNLIPRFKARGFTDIVVIDKAAANAAILKEHHPDVDVIVADLAVDDGWQDKLAGLDALVHAHAQIGGLVPEEFVRNNIKASERVMAAAKTHAVPYLVNISSSVVNSLAVDDYTETKKAQEALVLASGIPQIVLRPTLMFGWFDRKHVGWLARFMEKMPVFPIPGSGRYLRQPLYVGDFCNVIVAAVERRMTGAYNITGQERIDYIDLIREMKRATQLRTPIVRIPYRMFALLLRVYGLFSKNPPFTEKQLKALSTPDVFEVIDWPKIFGVRATPLATAFDETFRHPVYSKIALQF